MRVTSGMLSDRLLHDLRARQDAVARTGREVTSGMRIGRPSDDPLAARDAILQRAQLEGVEGHRMGVNSATTRLRSTDSALGQVTDVVHRARELALRAATGSMGLKEREAIALEIDHLAERAKESLRVNVDGAQLFSGTATGTPPYAAGSDVFAGNTAAVAREVGPGVSVQVNVSAGSILGSGQGAADGLLLNTLRDLADHLRGGSAADVAAIGTTDLQRLDANLETVTIARATIGATQVRVDAAETRLDDIEDAGELRLQDIEGADLAESLTRLSSEQSAYEAALRVGSSLIQTSLLDFLR